MNVTWTEQLAMLVVFPGIPILAAIVAVIADDLDNKFTRLIGNFLDIRRATTEMKKIGSFIDIKKD